MFRLCLTPLSHGTQGQISLDLVEPTLPQPFSNEQSFTTMRSHHPHASQCPTANLSRTACGCEAAEFCGGRRNRTPAHCCCFLFLALNFQPATPFLLVTILTQLTVHLLLTYVRASSCLSRCSVTASVKSLQPFRAQVVQGFDTGRKAGLWTCRPMT